MSPVSAFRMLIPVTAPSKRSFFRMVSILAVNGEVWFIPSCTASSMTFIEVARTGYGKNITMIRKNIHNHLFEIELLYNNAHTHHS